MVILKLAILLFVAVGAFWVRPENWTPFAPNGWADHGRGGAHLLRLHRLRRRLDRRRGGGEPPARHAARDDRGAGGHSIIYVVVTLVMTGLIPWSQHGTADSLASAFVDRGYDWAAAIISVGAVVSMASVLLVFQLGQPRIFSMARDGLLPGWAARLHPRYRTPHVTTILTGVFVAFFAAFANINEVIELTNIGTLFAFVLVAIGVMVLRLREPDWHRPFRTPAVWFVAPAAILSCGYLMIQLPGVTWVRFAVWLLLGIVIYAAYGYRKSRLRSRAAL